MTMSRFEAKTQRTSEAKSERIIFFEVKEDLRRILEARQVDVEVRDQLERLSEAEVQEALQEAIRFVTQDREMNQYLVGGEFLDETGKPRHRRILSLDIPTLVTRHPFLKQLCFKMVPVSASFEAEVEIGR